MRLLNKVFFGSGILIILQITYFPCFARGDEITETVSELAVVDAVLYYQPEQVHISFGDTTKDITVTFSTKSDPGESVCQYALHADQKFDKAIGESSAFVDGGSEQRTQFIHKVTLKNLTPLKSYRYRCGSKYGWSPEFFFRVPSDQPTATVKLAIFGDMGNENAQSLAYLQQETQDGNFDAVIHVGDFAYDMHSNQAKVGDEFMNQIQSVAAYAPYMVCPGNHEERYNFSNYRARFSMPGDSDSLFYSFNLGPVHFIGISTEVYYFMNYGMKMLVKQFDWLEADLKEASKPENRKERPWIITFGHRPMYCSNENGDDCTHHETLTRVGLPFLHFFGLEDLFYKYGVDVEIWAHEHSYERLWPIYDYKVYNGSYEQPYVNPKAPIHIVTGSAGCKEGREPFLHKIREWSAFHSQDYGFTRFTAFNTSHIYFEQVSVDKDGEIIDKLWVVKDQHGAYV